MISTAHLIYFSPTGTTRKICEDIANGLGSAKITHHDTTLPEGCFDLRLKDGVAIIGIPVYAGRVPELCLQRFKSITAEGVPCVLVALYGNREFEDALVELRDIVTTQGFQVIAAAAFIGEHSYSTAERPIAAGRPDNNDLALAVEFGKKVAAKLADNDFSTPEIDGNTPYKDRVVFGGVAPETDHQTCTLCGKCADVCPAGVITLSGQVVTDAAHCVMCCACVKSCEMGARPFRHERVEEKRAMLFQHCSTPKKPTIYLASKT